MPFRRAVTTITFTLLLAASTLRAEVPVAGSLDKPPEKPGLDNPCLKYLPDDAFVMGNIDVKSIIAWINAEKNPNVGLVMLKQYISVAQILTGIDPETEIDYLTVFVCGDPEKETKFLVAASGTFVTAAVEKKLFDQFPEAEVARVGGKNLYTLERSAFTLPEGGMLLLGHPDLVKAAMAKAKGEVNLPDALKSTLKQTDAGGALWIALKPKAILDLKDLANFSKENPDLAAKLRAIDYISVSASVVKDGYHLTATAALEEKEKAAAVAEFLATRKKTALTTEGVNAFYLPLLLASELETKDVHIRASLRLTESALKEIWDTKVVLKK